MLNLDAMSSVEQHPILRVEEYSTFGRHFVAWLVDAPLRFAVGLACVAAVVGRCRRSNTSRLFSLILLAPLFALLLLLPVRAMAQNDPPKDFRFEVLSIRPVDASPYGTPRFGSMNPDPNGFRALRRNW